MGGGLVRVAACSKSRRRNSSAGQQISQISNDLRSGSAVSMPTAVACPGSPTDATLQDFAAQAWAAASAVSG